MNPITISNIPQTEENCLYVINYINNLKYYNISNQRIYFLSIKESHRTSSLITFLYLTLILNLSMKMYFQEYKISLQTILSKDTNYTYLYLLPNIYHTEDNLKMNSETIMNYDLKLIHIKLIESNIIQD